MNKIQQRLKDHEEKIKKRLRDHDRKIQQRLKDHDRRLRGEKPDDRFLLAFNAFNRKPVYLTPEQLEAHWHILGGTRKGKSKYIEHIFQQLVGLKQGVGVIDPHGDLYQELVKYVSCYRLEDKTILIDLTQDEYIPGLNYLQVIKSETDTQEQIKQKLHILTDNLMDAIKRVFGEYEGDAKPQHERWSRDTYHVLGESGYTLVEAQDFLGIDNQAVRAKILSKVKDDVFLKEWQEFEGHPLQKRVFYATSVINRIIRFISNPLIRRIIGQIESTINFRQAMDEGKIILVNLNPVGKLTQQDKKMLGIIITNMIIEAATSRREKDLPKEKRKPYFWIVDEFAEIVRDEFGYALDACGKSRVWFVLAHQNIDQLKNDYPKIFGSIMSNTDIKISFAISAQDAEIMVKEMFAAKITGDKVKDEIWQTKFRPYIEYETVATHSHADSRASGRGHIESSGRGETGFQTQSIDPDANLFFPNVLGINVGEGQSLNFSSADSEFETSATTNGYSSTEVPVTHYEEFKEMTSRSYYTPEELKQKFIGWITGQEVRHAQLKTGTKGPIAIVAPWIPEIRVREKDVEKTKQKILPTCAKPIKEVDKELENRQNLLLGKSTAEPIDLSQADIEDAQYQEIPKKKKAKDPVSEKDYRIKV